MNIMKLLFAHSGRPLILEIISGLISQNIHVESIWDIKKEFYKITDSSKYDFSLIDLNEDFLEINSHSLKLLSSGISIFYLIHPQDEEKFLTKGWIREGNYFYNNLSARQLKQILFSVKQQKGLQSMQEEQYRVVVENANDGIIIAQDEMIVFYNIQCLAMTGYKPEEVAGKSIFEFITKEKRLATRKAFRRWIESKKPISIFETHLIKKDGSVIPVEMNSRVIVYKNKHSIIILMRDMSERISIHEALKESELSYRSIFDHAGDAIYIQDKDGFFLDVNPAATRMYGYTKEEMIGQTPAMLSAVGMNNLDETLAYLNEAFMGVPKRFEWWGRRKNGEIFPKDVVLNKGKYFGKEVVFAMARDIAERYEVLDALKKSEDKYRSLTNQLPVGVYRTTPDGNLIFSNPALLHILGYDSMDELINKNVRELYVNPMDRVNQLEASKNSDEVIQNEFQLHKKSGETIWVRDNSRVIFDNDGNPEYFDGVLENITNQKEAERALKESETKLRATLRANPDLMFRFDRSGNFLDFYTNKDAVLFVHPSAIIGSNIRDHFSEEIVNKTLFSIEKCLESGEVQTIEYELEINGEKRIFEARHAPLDKYEILSFSRDITEEKKKQDEFLMLARALMSVNDCVTITDKENNLLFVNNKFCEVYGYHRDEVIGRNVTILRANEPDDVKDTILSDTIASGWKGELLNRRKDGTIFPIQLSTSSVKDENNKIIVLIGVAADISSQKTVERELREAKEKAEESDRLKSAFLANMSHEIRSPMNAILGFTHLLQEENLSVTARQYMDMITTSGNHLLAVINDIMDISKIQANQLQIKISEFSLKELMDELFVSFSFQIKATDNNFVVLRKSIPPGKEDYNITTDKVRLKQIFLNLLSNAFKFTSRGYIDFGFETTGENELRFFVKDTGMGIPMELHDIIFERFRQADESLTRNYGGAGLGLSISKGLVDLMGGNIWVESEPGKGSSFYFTLPIENHRDH